jgi:predicted permease
VRSTSRHKEIAIRLALGIRRSRLRRQFLTEGLVLAGVAGLAAVLLAPLAAHTLVTAQGGALQIDTGLDARVLAFTAFVSLTAGCLVALPPMLASRGIKLLHTSEHSWTTSPIGSRRVPAHDVLVTLQIAMALSMLVTAALLVQSVQSLESIDPGFRADNVLLASLDPRARGFDANRIDGFWRATLEHVSRISGVESASLARTVPLGPGRQRQNWVNPGSGEKVNIDTNAVGPAYFRTLGITVLSGREFGHGDSHGSRPVVIVNERLAQMFWPQQDPIGKGIRLPDADKLVAEVIGVVRDVKYRDLRGEAGPMFYRPVLQTRSSDAMTLHVRTKNDPAALVSAIRLAIQNLDRNVPLFQITTLEERLDASFAQTRQAALLTGVFGVLALLLSGVGVYGVTALAVSRRTHDIGIRMALGARRRHIIRMIGARAGALIAVGLAVGLIGSLVFTRMFGTLLHGVGGNASTLLQMAALLGLLSLLASSIPVRAAIRVDAITAIRRE